jgi:hypothetical protein
MPYSALALGHEDLRLRSRRVRSDRSHRLSLRFALGVLVLTGLFALIGAMIREQSPPVVDAAAIDEGRYVAALVPIKDEIDQSAVHMGLSTAQYADGEIDVVELRARLLDDLTALRAAEAELDSIEPPHDLGGVRQNSVDAVRLFERSADELLSFSVDGNMEHLSSAVQLSLQGTARMHALGQRLGNAKSG